MLAMTQSAIGKHSVDWSELGGVIQHMLPRCKALEVCHTSGWCDEGGTDGLDSCWLQEWLCQPVVVN